jgi:hypothetical protein
VRAALAATTFALLAAVPVVASTGSTMPDLRSAAADRRHIVVVFKLGSDMVRGKIVVAASGKIGPGGEVKAGTVRVSEQLRPTATSAGYRARTRARLPRGRWYVQVSATALGLDCTPHKPCKSSWSNVRAVRIR